MTDAVEVYERADGQWAYRVKGQNGEVMAQSEGYANAFNANRGAQDLVRRLKDEDKNVIASADTFGAGGARPVLDPVSAVVDATAMDILVNNDEVRITLVGPKNKDSTRFTIKGENLTRLKERLIAAESAVPAKEAYLLSIIERATTHTATPLSIDALTDWVRNNRGSGVNPFISTDLESEVRDTVVDLFFSRRVRSDNKKGLVVVREGH